MKAASSYSARAPRTPRNHYISLLLLLGVQLLVILRSTLRIEKDVVSSQSNVEVHELSSLLNASYAKSVTDIDKVVQQVKIDQREFGSEKDAFAWREMHNRGSVSSEPIFKPPAGNHHEESRANCTSPEYTASSWIFSGSVHSHTSTLTCGLNANTPLSQYLKTLNLERYKQMCKGLVVYGVAFGHSYLSMVQKGKNKNTRTWIKSHGKCFFTFVLQGDVANITASADGVEWLVPIPRGVMPYVQMRRNTKLLKYYSSFLFPFAERIIWQDAKFKRTGLSHLRPTDYLSVGNQGACATFMGLPIHRDAIGGGKAQIPGYQPTLLDHCETVVQALKHRPSVTDSHTALIEQCELYAKEVAPEVLNRGLVDTGFIVWNEASEKCRAFNAELRCTLLDEINCHSDRDQIPFPYVLGKLDLNPLKLTRNTQHESLQLVKDNSTMVHITETRCHWYHAQQLGNCTPAILSLPQTPTKPRSVAVLIAGSFRRFFLNSTAHHLLAPLTRSNATVDFYLHLTQEMAPAYRQDAGYMNFITYDPVFGEKATDLESLTRAVVQSVGASLQAIDIVPSVAIESPKLKKIQQEAMAEHPDEDVDMRFPMIDLRPGAKQRTANGNRNMLKLFFALQHLWDIMAQSSQDYDYVLIARDDAFWMQDFYLDKVIARNPQADAYVLSCDAREPQMLSPELNDHAILIKREKAEVVGRYFTSLLNADIAACKQSVEGILGKDRGCNSEMLLNWILQKNHVKVEKVPQSALPFQRAVHIRQSDGSVMTCFHKFCQSKNDPLSVPQTMSKCKDVDFSVDKVRTQ